jgi:disulfide bond formation protein DsbB
VSVASLGRRLLRARTLYLGVALYAAAMIGFAMYLQEVKNLEPCPLCILQRYAFVAVGALALLAALAPRVIGRVLAWLAIVVGLSGAGVGAWHVWLQLHPPAVSACGPSLEYLIGNLPLGRALPRIFQGYGDCTEINWTFLGLSIPAWSLIMLSALALTLFFAQGRRK